MRFNAYGSSDLSLVGLNVQLGCIRKPEVIIYACILSGPPRGGGNWGILPWAPLCLWAPKRSIYSNRTVKYSIKVVTKYILPKLSQLPCINHII